MPRKPFKDNPTEELITPQGVTRTSTSSVSDLPTETVPGGTVAEQIKRELNLIEMERPVLKDERPVIVAPKVVPQRIPREDEALMNAGCEKLLAYLPSDTQELISEVRQAQAIPLWQIIAGYAMRCREYGEMFSPVILPDWESGIGPMTIRPCGTCGEALKPVIPGQGFCCNSCASGKRETLGHYDDCALVKADAA